MKVIGIFILLPMIAVLLNCANPDLVEPGGEGNGSETTARGVVVDCMGIPVAGVPVQLLPAAYNPVVHDTFSAQWRTVSDGRGEYRFNRITAGTYALEAGSASIGTMALVKGIEISGRKTEVAVDTGSLRKTGTVIVRLAAVTPRGGDYVYLPGTNTFTFISAQDSAAGKTVLNGVPSGTFTDLIYIAVADSHRTDLLNDTLILQPGDTLASAYAAWKYRKQLLFNTTVSGANIPGNVYNFPVLVRLDGSNFDFSQAKNNGEDIRFVKSDGSPLTHEIERWNSVAEFAEVWVRIDTVYGNSNSQTITMHWGNESAGNSSNSAAVFDTATGFQGVWHLGDVSKDTVYDATLNRYHGVSPDSALPSGAEGVVGNCRQFDGKADFITMPNTAASKINLQQDGNYSISAWVSADTFIAQQQTLVSKGRYQYFLWIDSTSWKFWEYQDLAGWESSAQKATLKQWVLLTGVRNGGRQYLYVNGVSIDTIRSIPDPAPRNTGSDLNVGRAHELETAIKEYASLCYFRGKIDEIRISSVSYNSDWIKLCYMNQRVDDKLIVFK